MHTVRVLVHDVQSEMFKIVDLDTIACEPDSYVRMLEVGRFRS